MDQPQDQPDVQVPGSQPVQSPAQPAMSGQETFNVVTDTVGGPNLRWKDNLFQALSILVCAIIGAGVLFFFFKTWLAAMGGIVAGMIVGTFTSGFVLMIYRGVRHLGGRHD